MSDFLDQLQIEKVADEYTYASLPLCVIDSVFSIGVRYESVRNVLERYCAFAKVPRLSPTRTVPPRAQQQSITAFLQLASAFDAEQLAVEVFGNRQRTSTHAGLLKADAVVRFADGGVFACAARGTRTSGHGQGRSGWVRAQARGAGSPKGSRLQTGRVDLVTASQSQVALDSVGTPSVSRPGAPPLKGHAVGSAEKPDRPGPESGAAA